MNIETPGPQDKEAMQQLQEEHRRYAEKLDGLLNTTYLSAEDQLEEVRLKKLKLRVKDEIMGNRPIFRFN